MDSITTPHPDAATLPAPVAGRGPSAEPGARERLDCAARHGAPRTPEHITMLLENNPYPQDVRVRSEAESLARAGHHVTVIAPRDRGQARSEVVRGVQVIRFRLVDGSTRGALGFVLEYLVAGLALHWHAIRSLLRGATVLHIHNPPDLFFAAGALFRLAGRKVIFDHHDLFPETVEVKFGGGPPAAVARICQRLTMAVANHVIATNGSYADVARIEGGKSPTQVTVVRNAPPAAWLDLPLRIREGRLATIRLAYLGALSSQDGVVGLAPVLANLRDMAEPIDVRLSIIGDGDARPLLERELAELGLAGQVTFEGWVPADRVPQLLQDADVCVDPAPATDVNQRSTMTKIAEYLALGKPVVAYDLLETRRTAGEAATLVSPGDTAGFAEAIARLAGAPEERARLAHEARVRAAQLTWEQSERALLSAYEALSLGAVS
jgi:glycosyltransferase involved in cell wall biosynthesis